MAKKKRILWKVKGNKLTITNPEVLKEYIGCNLERDCNSCGFRDKCLKIAIRRGYSV